MKYCSFEFSVIGDGNHFGLPSLKKKFKKLSKRLSFKIVGKAFKVFDNNIKMNTGAYVLSTSHLCWHTFPEYSQIIISIGTCSDKSYSQLVKTTRKFLEKKFPNCKVELIS